MVFVRLAVARKKLRLVPFKLCSARSESFVHGRRPGFRGNTKGNVLVAVMILCSSRRKGEVAAVYLLRNMAAIESSPAE
jgi:hypothetical protein